MKPYYLNIFSAGFCAAAMLANLFGGHPILAALNAFMACANIGWVYIVTAD